MNPGGFRDDQQANRPLPGIAGRGWRIDDPQDTLDPNTCPSCGHPWELHGEPELPPICSYQRSSPDATDGCRCARPRPAVVLGEPT